MCALHTLPAGRDGRRRRRRAWQPAYRGLSLIAPPPPPHPGAAEEGAFFELLHTFFPAIFDVKYLMASCDSLKGGLNKLAEDLDVERVGPMHQAGSDSLLTASTFFKMRQVYFDGAIGDKYVGILYGLGAGSNLA